MQIEIAAGFRLLCGLELAPLFWLTVGETIGARALLVLPLLGSLTGEPKIYQFNHVPTMTVSGYIDYPRLNCPIDAPGRWFKEYTCRIPSATVSNGIHG